MKRLLIICVCTLFGLIVQAQEIIKLSRNEAEAIFLKNNLQLISEKLNIESQKAEVIQAKLWENPTLSIGEINFWATDRQTGGQEASPPFWNNYGKNQQISVGIEQLIQTAGKRKKLISLEQVDVSKSEQYFEDLLRALKLELRNKLTDLQHIQQSIKVHQNLIENIATLTNAYKNQLDKGNISKAEHIRLKAQELEITKEILELTNTSNNIQKELKLLLRTDATATLEITDDGFIKNTTPFKSVFIEQVFENAKENRPDYKLVMLQEEYSNKLLSYEKAQRIPDITFGVNYDRNGSTMLDFVGFGVSFDLPVFNRNKGNITKAKIGIESAKLLTQHTVNTIENEIYLAYKSLLQAIYFVEKIEPEYESDLDLLLENYTKNFKLKNVSMLEYIDFIDTYLGNKKIILEAQKDINQKAEEFNYYLGKDFKN